MRRPDMSLKRGTKTKPEAIAAATGEGPLNPTLHFMLEKFFGDVEIVAPGEELQWGTGDKVLSSGEEYRVNCPFCSDTRKRLYINHRWGVYDEDTDSLNLFLCRCFNEECVSQGSRQWLLHERIFIRDSVEARGQMSVRQGTRDVARASIREMSLPGEVVPLWDLEKEDPTHHAIRYIQSRGFSPEYLTRRFQVGYCRHSRYGLAAGRIIIPVYRDKLLVGWQARWPDDSYYGSSFKEAGVPKYWTCPQMKAGLIGYNTDAAAKYKLSVIVEGPVDAWRLGGRGIGLLGKKLNKSVAKRIYDLGHSRIEAVAIMLDPDQHPDEIARGIPHHIETAATTMLEFFPGKVIRVYLPSGCDAGSLDTDFLLDAVRQQGAEQGVAVPLCEPSRHHDPVEYR